MWISEVVHWVDLKANAPLLQKNFSDKIPNAKESAGEISRSAKTFPVFWIKTPRKNLNQIRKKLPILRDSSKSPKRFPMNSSSDQELLSAGEGPQIIFLVKIIFDEKLFFVRPELKYSEWNSTFILLRYDSTTYERVDQSIAFSSAQGWNWTRFLFNVIQKVFQNLFFRFWVQFLAQKTLFQTYFDSNEPPHFLKKNMISYKYRQKISYPESFCSRRFWIKMT